MATINGTSGNDNLRGTAAADRLNGHGGDDVLTGFGGNDTLNGGAGFDTLRGGAGNDLYLLSDRDDQVLDSGGFDTVIMNVFEDYHLAAGVEVLIVRGSENTFPGEVTAYGNDLDNTLRNERTDSQMVYLAGLGGDDVVIGGSGLDYIDFGSASGDYGNDYADGGGGDRDIMHFADNSDVIVDFRDGFATGGGVDGSGTVTFLNIEMATTGDGNDLIIGDAQGQFMYAGGGDDTLKGGAGNDMLDGDTERLLDIWPIDSGQDRLLGGAGEDSLFGGNGNDHLDGGTGSDRLFGGGGINRLVWDPGDSVIDGGISNEDRLLVRQSLDLRAVADDLIDDVEILDMTGGGNNRLTLKASDLLALSPDTDTIKVLGNAGDSVNIVGAFTDQGVEGGFHRYRVGSATLLVDTDITNVS